MNEPREELLNYNQFRVNREADRVERLTRIQECEELLQLAVEKRNACTDPEAMDVVNSMVLVLSARLKELKRA